MKKDACNELPNLAVGNKILHSPEILTLKRMKYFLAVADTGQITTAAHAIHVSPAVITVAIRQMEGFLSVKLFERDRLGMHLTMDGVRFRGYCEKVLSLVTDAVWSLKKTSQLVGDLTLAASPAVHGYFLPLLLSRFRHLYPKINIHLSELEREEIEDNVVSGELDAGIVLVSNVKNRKRLDVSTLFSSRRTLWCSANHHFSEMPVVSLADIANEPYIQLSIEEAEKNTEVIFTQHGQAPKYYLHTETLEAVRGYVAQNEGVTILSELLFHPWSLEGSRIVSRPVAEKLPLLEVGVISKKKQQHSPAQTALCEFLAFHKNEVAV